jgi:hypothetical protein
MIRGLGFVILHVSYSSFDTCKMQKKRSVREQTPLQQNAQSYVINYVFLDVLLTGARLVRWTDDVHLVVLELVIALVDVDYVICVVYSKSEIIIKKPISILK